MKTSLTYDLEREILKKVNPELATIDPISALRLMRLAREVDRREGSLIRQGKGWIHIPSEGHEALAMLGLHMHEGDLLFGYYRDRPLFLARGMTPEQMAHDYFATALSSTKGRGMPMHGTSKTLGIFPPVTPTGAQCLPAVGAAWGIKLSTACHVVVCTIGDASTRQGEFYEALCFAVQGQLPIVFVVEDNGYGISTPTLKHSPFQLGIFADALVQRVDARDYEKVFAAGAEAITKARLGGGPTLLWCEMDRLVSHTNSDDHRIYRTSAEIDEMTARDPVPMLTRRLIAAGMLDAEAWRAEEERIKQEVDACYLAAEQSAAPEEAQVLSDVYDKAREVECADYADVPFQPGEANVTMVAAIGLTLHAALERDPKVLLFGEDIEDPKGGVFGLTKGLSAGFPGRVFNSPLAEATIVGAAVGLAATGFRPVFELQFIDFLAPAFNQLANQLATLRWRSGGQWTCPLVLYAPYGAYLPAGGMWHSQSNEGWWTHIPGLRVAVPSTPADAVGLFWSALQDDDPSLILLPKHIFRKKLPAKVYMPIPFGRSTVRRAGTDVTLVTWGNCLELADQAATIMAERGIQVEVIDLRTLVPCDWEGIERSIEKTGRLVVVTEDTRTCSFGQAVVAELVSMPRRFNHFYSAPILVARPEVGVPYRPSLEAAVLPDVPETLHAIETVLEGGVHE
jgi:2-oxoisovalerate dehydrogenase E1 component